MTQNRDATNICFDFDIRRNQNPPSFLVFMPCPTGPALPGFWKRVRSEGRMDQLADLPDAILVLPYPTFFSRPLNSSPLLSSRKPDLPLKHWPSSKLGPCPQGWSAGEGELPTSQAFPLPAYCHQRAFDFPGTLPTFSAVASHYHFARPLSYLL